MNSLHIVAMTLIGVGVAFDLVGTIGLVRLPDIYNRLQASTKCVTLGTSLILVGVFVLFGISATGVKALFAVWFIAMTSPTAAHALARGAHRSGVPLWPGSVIDRYVESRSKGETGGSASHGEDS
jgi:multicomponent Na+:H+ antiporter subunit G